MRNSLSNISILNINDREEKNRNLQEIHIKKELTNKTSLKKNFGIIVSK